MPAKSKAQRKMMAIAKRHPEKLYKRNRGALEMSQEELHKFASTREKGLPGYRGQQKRSRGKRR